MGLNGLKSWRILIHCEKWPFCDLRNKVKTGLGYFICCILSLCIFYVRYFERKEGVQKNWWNNKKSHDNENWTIIQGRDCQLWIIYFHSMWRSVKIWWNSGSRDHIFLQLNTPVADSLLLKCSPLPCQYPSHNFVVFLENFALPLFYFDPTHTLLIPTPPPFSKFWMIF